MQRHRLAPLTLVLLLAASACGEATQAVTTSTAAPVPTEPGSAPAPPQPVEVPQIASSPVEDVPSAIDSMTDIGFPPPLVVPAEIVSGGPPPDGIPPIDAPLFEHADAVDWLTAEEPVLTITIENEARAYPIQIMTWHEIVNDTIGTIPVTISYCPLCNSAVAYDRRLGHRILDFGTSGMLYNSSLVMYDRQTESLWTHFNGEAVVGFLTGEVLDTFPVATVSFADFVAANPEGIVLSRDTGYDRDYGRNPYLEYDDPDGDPFLFTGDRDDRLRPQTRVVAIRGATETIVIQQEPLIEAGVKRTTIDGTALTAFGAPGTTSALDAARIPDGKDVGATGVFESELDGQLLTFSRTASDRWTDEETTSQWNIFGVAVAGPLKGSQLTRIEHLNTFWFAIAAFDPDTLIVDG